MLTACAFSASRPHLRKPSRDLVVPGDGFLKTYDNGLTLMVVPDPYARVVQFDVRHEVGSRDEPIGQEGVAHFVEHLMYELPSKGPGTTTLYAEARARSVAFNAYTALDETHYQYTGISEQLPTYVEHTAKRLNFDCGAIDDAALEQVTEIIRNELRERRGTSSMQVRDQIVAAIYPEEHPYHHSEADYERLDSLTWHQLCTFATEHYTTDRTTIVVTGNVDPLAVLELTNQTLEPLPAKESDPRTAIPEFELPVGRVSLESPVSSPSALVVFQMPRRFTEDYVATQVAATGIEISLETVINRDRGNNDRWDFTFSSWLGGKEAPVWAIAVEPDEDTSLDDAVDEVLEVLEHGGKMNPTTGSYDRIRQIRRLQLVDELASISTRSKAYADYLEEGDTPGFVGAELAAIDTLDEQEIQAAWRDVFSRDRAMLIELTPTEDPGRVQIDPEPFAYDPTRHERLYLPDDIGADEANRPLEVVEIAPPDLDLVAYRTSNGMRVVLAASSQFPVMHTQLMVGAGTAHSRRHPETAKLAMDLYRVHARESAKVLRQFFNAGGVYSRSMDAYSTTYRAQGLSIYLDFILAGLSDRILQAQYSNDGFDQWKKTARVLAENPKIAAALRRRQLLLSSLYGEGHPLARSPGGPKDIKKVRGVPVNRFRSRYFRAPNATLVVTGNFDMALATDHIEAGFGKPRNTNQFTVWNRRMDYTTPEIPPISPHWGRTLTQVDDDRVQTEVQLIYPMDSVYGRRHAALLVLAAMLDLSVSRVREELSVSYGASAFLDRDQPSLVVTASLDSGRANEGLEALRASIIAATSADDFERRFAFARRQQMESMLLTHGDPGRLADELATAVRHEGSVNYFYALAERIAVLQPSDVVAVAHELFDHGGPITHVIGPGDSIEQIVAGLDPSTVLELPETPR
ncbi:MAG: insulinase family protein [Myxococcota bacterium]